MAVVGEAARLDVLVGAAASEAADSGGPHTIGNGRPQGAIHGPVQGLGHSKARVGVVVGPNKSTAAAPTAASVPGSLRLSANLPAKLYPLPDARARPLGHRHP